jgi:anti-sigma-K factor RskA
VKYRDPQTREAIAAEYALGTLQGRARSRFERSLKDDPQLRQLVATWRERLAPLDELVEPVAPPARVWQHIHDRIGIHTRSRRIWTTLAFWRVATLLSTACAVVLAVYLATLPPRSTELMVVVMQGDQGNPAMTVSWPMGGKGERKMRIRVIGHAEMAPNTAWELWMLPGGNQNPVSLGLIGTEPTQELQVPEELAALINQAYGLAMSVEPSGGSPTGLPTGPVIYKGQRTPL